MRDLYIVLKYLLTKELLVKKRESGNFRVG